MKMLFIKHFYVGFMVSEIPIVSVFGYVPHMCINYVIKYNIYKSKSSNRFIIKSQI